MSARLKICYGPGCSRAEAGLLVNTLVPLRHDMTIAIKKHDFADALGLGDTDEDTPFEMNGPSFTQKVTMTETYDHFTVKPYYGWKKNPVLEFSYTVTLRGVSKRGCGCYEVDLTQDADGVAINEPSSFFHRFRNPFRGLFRRKPINIHIPTVKQGKGDEPLLIVLGA